MTQGIQRCRGKRGSQSGNDLQKKCREGKNHLIPRKRSHIQGLKTKFLLILRDLQHQGELIAADSFLRCDIVCYFLSLNSFFPRLNSPLRSRHPLSLTRLLSSFFTCLCMLITLSNEFFFFFFQSGKEKCLFKKHDSFLSVYIMQSYMRIVNFLDSLMPLYSYCTRGGIWVTR